MKGVCHISTDAQYIFNVLVLRCSLLKKREAGTNFNGKQPKIIVIYSGAVVSELGHYF